MESVLERPAQTTSPTNPAKPSAPVMPAAPSPAAPEVSKSPMARARDALSKQDYSKDQEKPAESSVLESPKVPAQKPATETSEKLAEPKTDTESEIESPSPADPPDEELAAVTKRDKGKGWALKEYWQKKHAVSETEWTTKYATLEKQFKELQSKPAEDPEKKTLSEKYAALEKKHQEMENKLRYADYRESEEFINKYQKPYEDYFTRAVTEVTEIPVTGPDGSTRKGTADDLVVLANLPLGEARKLANEAFGDFADDVMQHRKQLRDLWSEQQRALDVAKKEAGQRHQEQQEKITRQKKETEQFLAQSWEEANKAALSHPEYGDYFKPVKGDDESNAKLEKGYKLVDDAFAQDPYDPKLSTEQRAKVIKLHAAVRNRAAAFGRLVAENKKLKAQLAEREQALGEYQGTEPGAGNGKAKQDDTPPSGMAGIDARLRKYTA